MPGRLRESTKNFEKKTGKTKSFRFIPELLQFKPVKEGEEINVVIDDIGSRGDGTARAGGFLIFVPNSKTGERVRVRILRVSRNFALAEIIERVEHEEGGKNEDK